MNKLFSQFSTRLLCLVLLLNISISAFSQGSSPLLTSAQCQSDCCERLVGRVSFSYCDEGEAPSSWDKDKITYEGPANQSVALQGMSYTNSNTLSDNQYAIVKNPNILKLNNTSLQNKPSEGMLVFRKNGDSFVYTITGLNKDSQSGTLPDATMSYFVRIKMYNVGAGTDCNNHGNNIEVNVAGLVNNDFNGDVVRNGRYVLNGCNGTKEAAWPGRQQLTSNDVLKRYGDYVVFEGTYRIGQNAAGHWKESNSDGFKITIKPNFYDNYAIGIESIEVYGCMPGESAGAVSPNPLENLCPFTNPSVSAPVLSVVSKDTESVNISWTGTEGASHYELYRCSNASGGCNVLVAGNLQTTNFKETGLSAGTSYYYKVVAKVPGANDAESKILSVITNYEYAYVPFEDGTCNNNACATKLVGRVSFANKNGSSAQRWSLNDVETYGPATQTITTNKSYTTGNVKGTGNYAIVENPKVLNESLQDINTDGIFLIQSSDDVLTYTIKGLNKANPNIAANEMTYCVRVKLRNVGTTNNCNNNVGNNITIKIKNQDGMDFSNGSRLWGTGGVSNRGNFGKWTTTNLVCSGKNRTGNWNGNDQINPNPVGIIGDEAVFEGTFIIGGGRTKASGSGSDDNPFINDDGFQIVINGPDNNGDNIFGIEEIEIYGCIPEPVIEATPGDNVSAGTDVTLTVKNMCADGSPYVWRVNNENGALLSSTTNKLTTTIDKTTTFWVSCGGKSLTKTITVAQGIKSSAGDSFCEGTSTTLQAVGMGTDSDVYTWQETINGVTTVLPGSHSSIQVTPRLGLVTYTVSINAQRLSKIIEVVNCCTIQNDKYSITKICDAVTINGLEKPIWSILLWQKIDGTNAVTLVDNGANGGDCSSGCGVETDKLAQWRAMCDDANIYFFVRIFDPNPRTVGQGIQAKPWSQDGIEIFLEKKGATQPQQFGYTWNGNNTVTKYPYTSTPVSEVATRKYGDYWDVEIRIPIAANNINIVDNKVRMELGLNQAKDGSNRRTAQIFTWKAYNHYGTTQFLNDISLNNCMETTASVSEICNGQTVTISTQMSSANGMYEWQQKQDASSSWTIIATTPDKSIEVTPTANKTQYRAVMSGSVATCPVTVTMDHCSSPGVASCAAENIGTADYAIQKVCGPPTVAEDWQVASWQSVTIPHTLNDATGNCKTLEVLQTTAGKWRAVYDDENIYFFIRVNDGSPSNNASTNVNAWQGDGVEVFVKDKSGTSKQHGAGYSSTSTAGRSYGALTGTQKILPKTSSDYWEMEITIPVAANNIDLSAELIQLEVGINQSRNYEACRAAQLFTWSAGNHYAQGTTYGKAKLVNCLQLTASKTEVCTGETITISTMLKSTAQNAYEWQQRNSESNEWKTFDTNNYSTMNVIPDVDGMQFRVLVDGIATCPVTVTVDYCPSPAVTACAAENMGDAKYAIQKVCGPPTVTEDWNIAAWQSVTVPYTLNDAAGNCKSLEVLQTTAGKWRAVYDNENIYFYIRVNDGNPSNNTSTNASAWQGDGVEVFVKDRNGTSKQHGVGYSSASTAGKPYGALIGTQKILAKTSPDYWEMEITIPATQNNIDLYADFLQIEVGINQSRNYEACRAAQLFTWSAGNHYAQGTTYGKAKLVNCLQTVASKKEVCTNETISISTMLKSTAQNAYEWQQRNSESSEWTTFDTNSSSSVNVQPVVNGMQYRVIVDGIATCPVTIIMDCPPPSITACATENIGNADYALQKVCGAPAITEDWNIAAWQSITVPHTLNDATGNCKTLGIQEPVAGKWRAVYDDENIYFFIRVNDGNPYNNITTNASAWQGDGVEVFVKDKNGTSKQHGVGYSATNTAGKPYGALTGTQKILPKTSPDYWEMEITIPAAANNIDLSAELVQLEVGINQARYGENCRAAQLFTWTAGNHYAAGTTYGKAKLINCLQTIASKTEACANETITITSKIKSTDGQGYKFQQRYSEKDNWITITATSYHTINVAPTINGMQFRVIVDGIATCPVTINSPINVKAFADITTYCLGEEINIDGLYYTTKEDLQWGWKKSTTVDYYTSSWVTDYYLSDNPAKKTLKKSAVADDDAYFFFVVKERYNSCESFSQPIKIQTDPSCGNKYICADDNNYSVFTISRTCSAPVIDGSDYDEAWKAAPWIEIDGSASQTLTDPVHDCKQGDCLILENNPAAEWRAVYDDEYIYYFIRVYDDNPHNDDGTYYGDGVEIFLRDKNGTTVHQYGIGYGQSEGKMYGKNYYQVQQKIQKYDKYWNVEVAIPLKENNIDISAGTIYTEVGVNQSPDERYNGKEYRAAQLFTWEPYNHYLNASKYHPVTLSNCASQQKTCTEVAGTYIQRTAKTVSIDGNANEIVWETAPWRNISIEHMLNDSHACTINKVGKAQPSPAGKWRALYDDTYIYFNVRVFDESPLNSSTGNTTNANWWQDGVEVYINNKQYGYTYRNGIPYTYGTATDKGAARITTNSAAGTWDLEVRIPISTNGISLSAGNLPIEVAINQSSPEGCRLAQVFTYKALNHFNTPGHLTPVPLNNCGQSASADDVTIHKACQSPTMTTGKIYEEEWTVATWTKIGVAHPNLNVPGKDCPPTAANPKEIANPGGRWRALYDDENLYFHVEVFDAAPNNNSTSGDVHWWQDGVEIYVNDKTQYGYAYSNESNKPFLYGNAVDKGISYIVREENKWNLIVQIPLGINGIDISKGFVELEVAINESLGDETCRSAQMFTWTASDHYQYGGRLKPVTLSNCLQTIATPRELTCYGSITLTAGIKSTDPSHYYMWEQSTDGGLTWQELKNYYYNNINIMPTEHKTLYRARVHEIVTCPVEVILHPCEGPNQPGNGEDPCIGLPQIIIEEPTCDRLGTLSLEQNSLYETKECKVIWKNANGEEIGQPNSTTLTNVSPGTYFAEIACDKCEKTIEVKVTQAEEEGHGLLGTYNQANGATQQQIDPVVDFIWDGSVHPESAVWEGCLDISCDEETGEFYFYIPEGGKLYIDGKLVIGE